MRINPRGQRRADRRQSSQGQRMPRRLRSSPELRATNVRVQALSISQIKLNQRNSRTHSAKQIRQIANSIVAFGFTNPLLVTEDGTLIAGEGRYRAAQLLGLAKVPVIVLAGLSPARQRALAIADNKIAENAGWDRERLAIEIPELAGLLETEGLDVSILGFEAVEIDQLLTDFEEDAADPAGQYRPQVVEGRCGQQAWRSVGARPAQAALRRRSLGGRHRSPDGALPRRHGVPGPAVQCAHRRRGGSGQDEALRVRHGERRDVVCGLRALPRHYSECRSISVARRCTSLCLHRLAAHCRADGSRQACLWRHHQHRRVGEVECWPRLVLPQPTRVCRRLSRRAGATSKQCRARAAWAFALERLALRRSELLPAGRMEELRSHPSAKPVALVADAIKDCTRRGDVVLDTFCGSGTTIMAAERVGRHARALEIEPRFVDVAIRRWQAFTRRDARHAESGLSFDEIAAEGSRSGRFASRSDEAKP